MYINKYYCLTKKLTRANHAIYFCASNMIVQPFVIFWIFFFKLGHIKEILLEKEQMEKEKREKEKRHDKKNGLTKTAYLMRSVCRKISQKKFERSRQSASNS